MGHDAEPQALRRNPPSVSAQTQHDAIVAPEALFTTWQRARRSEARHRDLLITWKTQRIALELKMRHRPTSEAKGIAQFGGYLERLGLDEGWLVLFDHKSTAPWDARIYTRTETAGARRIHVVGC